MVMLSSDLLTLVSSLTELQQPQPAWAFVKQIYITMLHAFVYHVYKRNALSVLNPRQCKYDVMLALRVPCVLQTVQIGMDRKDRERELVSALLSNLYPTSISQEEMAKGFTRLLLFTEVQGPACLSKCCPNDV